MVKATGETKCLYGQRAAAQQRLVGTDNRRLRLSLGFVDHAADLRREGFECNMIRGQEGQLAEEAITAAT